MFCFRFLGMMKEAAKKRLAVWKRLCWAASQASQNWGKCWVWFQGCSVVFQVPLKSKGSGNDQLSFPPVSSDTFSIFFTLVPRFLLITGKTSLLEKNKRKKLAYKNIASNQLSLNKLRRWLPLSRSRLRCFSPHTFVKHSLTTHLVLPSFILYCY